MNIGLIYVVLAQFMWAGEIIIVRRFFPTQNPIFISAITSLTATVFYLPSAIVFKQKISLNEWLILLVLGFISFFLAQILYITGIQKGGNIYTIVLATLTYYLFAVILGIIFLKEPLSLKTILGGLLMIIGFIIISFK